MIMINYFYHLRYNCNFVLDFYYLSSLVDCWSSVSKKNNLHSMHLNLKNKFVATDA